MQLEVVVYSDIPLEVEAGTEEACFDIHGEVAAVAGVMLVTTYSDNSFEVVDDSDKFLGAGERVRVHADRALGAVAHFDKSSFAVLQEAVRSIRL